MAVTHTRGFITYHNVTIREAITRDVIAAAVDAIDAGYRCLGAWRLGRRAPREGWALIRMFADID